MLVDRDCAGVDTTRSIAVIQFGAELFFANVGSFRDAVLAEVDGGQIGAIVIDAEAITDIDTTAAEELLKLREVLASQDVILAVARLQDPARQAMEAAGLDLSDRDFARVEDAVERLSIA